jgi:ribonuclease E
VPDTDTPTDVSVDTSGGASPDTADASPADQQAAPATRPRRRRAATRPAGPPEAVATFAAAEQDLGAPAAPGQAPPPLAAPLFQPPEPSEAPPRRRSRSKAASPDAADETAPAAAPEPATDERDEQAAQGQGEDDESEGGEQQGRRRRRRGGRGRRKTTGEAGQGDAEQAGAQAGPEQAGAERAGPEQAGGGTAEDAAAEAPEAGAEPVEGGPDGAGEQTGSASSRRRRRRRKKPGSGEAEPRSDDPEETVVRVRETRRDSDAVTATRGSTRMEAKKQRRRDGRESGRRRPTIMSESEFLARRESVERVMLVRQRGTREQPLTQIAVLEDGVLVEHYVDQGAQRSIIGNIYLGKVQNVLPAMEAAFVDIGRGRNAVLYAGEVDWSEHEGKPKRIEDALSVGESVLVQVSKDPIGHKGARLTSSISLPGRFVVYVPGGSMSGISRKLPTPSGLGCAASSRTWSPTTPRSSSARRPREPARTSCVATWRG